MDVQLANGQTWKFKENPGWEGLTCITKKGTTYRLFVDTQEKYGYEIDIWIGRWWPKHNAWVTAEADIRADAVPLLRGVIRFVRRPYSRRRRK